MTLPLKGIGRGTPSPCTAPAYALESTEEVDLGRSLRFCIAALGACACVAMGYVSRDCVPTPRHWYAYTDMAGPRDDRDSVSLCCAVWINGVQGGVDGDVVALASVANSCAFDPVDRSFTMLAVLKSHNVPS